MKLKTITKIINIYPPYLGSGISVKSVNEDFTQITTQMKLRWYNRNAVGTHFGGSLYSMCDPFYMFILMEHLGNGYIVWDKAASINFVKAEKKPVTATFEISKEKIAEIKEMVDTHGKGNFTFHTTINNEQGDVIAEVEKVVYVRNKKFVRQTNNTAASTSV